MWEERREEDHERRPRDNPTTRPRKRRTTGQQDPERRGGDRKTRSQDRKLELRLLLGFGLEEHTGSIQVSWSSSSAFVG